MLQLNFQTNKLIHFVSLIFSKQFIISYLAQNLVSLVSFVSHFRETNILFSPVLPAYGW
ncbi:MAG: hypothetical protein JWR50_4302 [Mucilaginibacter sp.]|nr:hypothetical protein [Mucilaginibacter sp.]